MSQVVAAPARKPDRFLVTPFVIAVALWLSFEASVIYSDDAGMLPPTSFMMLLWVAFWILFFALIFLIAFLCLLRWRSSLSVVMGAAVFLAMTVISSEFTHQTRWYLRRAEFVSRLAAVQPTLPHNVRNVSWDSGLGWFIWLEYYEDDQAAATQARQPQPDKTSERSSPCKQTLRRLEAHYYLYGLYC